MRRFSLVLLVLAAFAVAPVAASDPPRLVFGDNTFNRKWMNPKPRPYAGRTQISTDTSIYFELLVPDANGAAGALDPDSITATLIPSGGAAQPMLQAGQVFAAGFSGELIHAIDSGADNGEAVYLVPASPLDPARQHTVTVYAETLDGVPISGTDSWSFTTRGALNAPTASWSIDLAGPTVSWDGWFFAGIIKPNFNTSRVFDQQDSYLLMDAVHAINPDAWSIQRDWPLTSDYWHNGVFDGNPNIVREQETRRIASVVNQGQTTILAVQDLEEGALYGIAPGRPLSADYQAGDQVTVADREKFEVATVVSVNDNKGEVKVDTMLTAPSAWILDYAGSHPADNPDTPDNFTFPLCYLRKLNPVGTPVYYWARVDDEWDLVHGQHGRRVEVNFSYIPLALSREPVPAHPGGHGSITPPKDYLQWHDFVRQTIFHLIDRYGQPTENFLYSVGNEYNFGIFWNGTKDDFYEYYDYTVNAVLTAFEDRGLDASRVRVGGLEAAGLGGVGWIRDALYHNSPTGNKPGGGIVEQNFVCVNPAFADKRAARVDALCTANANRGSPLDFVSIHEYEHVSRAVADMHQVRADSLAIDPVFYDTLSVDSFEATPDWIPRPDPAAHAMFLGNGFLPSWAADWMQRLVERAESDPRYAHHESMLTVWPFDYNGNGITSVTGLMSADDDGDGQEDRIVTVKKAFFNWVEALAKMSRELDALPARQIEGIRVAGVRSVVAGGHVVMLYSHDWQDTDSRETAEITGQLSLSSLPWEHATVRRWRIDRDHSSPFRAFQALPDQDVFTPAELADLEASDDLVEDGPPVDHDTGAGTLDLDVPVGVNGTTFLDIRERDLDADGLADSLDNCPAAANPGQADGDTDGFGTVCDCDDGLAGVWAAPVEVDGLTVHRDGAGQTTLDWSSQSASAGPATVYDVADGPLGQLIADAGYDDAVCLLSMAGEPPVVDPGADPASGEGRYYLIRARNACGVSGYGPPSLDPGPCP